MKLFQNLLTESKREDAELATMIEKLYQVEGAKDLFIPINGMVTSAKNLGLRHDRSVVIMRALRWNMVNSVVHNDAYTDDPKLKKYISDIYNKDSDYGKLSRVMMAHYRDMFSRCVPMKNYSWSGKSPDQIIADLGNLEKKWNESRVGTIEINDTDKPIIEFPDGYAWVLLPRGGCPVEGDAMGHCGNGSGYDAEAIYSLRQKVNIDGSAAWKPYLTFIVHEDKTLGEMKGRGNAKPSPKYHDKIIALLKSNYVNSIQGGGYKPENNFDIMDLSLPKRKGLVQKTALWGKGAVRFDGGLEIIAEDPITKHKYTKWRDDEIHKVHIVDDELNVARIGEPVTSNGVILPRAGLGGAMIFEFVKSGHVSAIDKYELTTINYENQKTLAETKPHLWSDRLLTYSGAQDSLQSAIYPSVNITKLAKASPLFKNDKRLILIDDLNDGVLILEKLSGDIYAVLAGLAKKKHRSYLNHGRWPKLSLEEYKAIYQHSKELAEEIRPTILPDSVIANRLKTGEYIHGIIETENNFNAPVLNLEKYVWDSVSGIYELYEKSDYGFWIRTPAWIIADNADLSIHHLSNAHIPALIGFLEGEVFMVGDTLAVSTREEESYAAVVDFYRNTSTKVKRVAR